MKTGKFIQYRVICEKKKNNTLQTLMIRISLITENVGILSNNFFLKKNKSKESIVLTEKDKTMSRKMKWLIF